MFTNLYTTEKLAAARQRELREEAAKQRLLAELTGDRQPWTRCAAQYLWAWLGTLGAQREGTRMARLTADSEAITVSLGHTATSPPTQ